VFLRLVRMVLQISGMEFIVLGFMSWIAALWVQHEKFQYPNTADKSAYEKAYEKVLDSLVALDDLSRTLTHSPPYIALTVLGILLIALGTSVRWLDTDG
jgi:hypothetical protein